MPKAFLVIRVKLADPARREAFDDWYHREHLPDAIKAFRCEKAWRFWSETDPATHQATYRFADRAAIDKALASDGFKKLIADFDRDWPNMPRSREILTLADELGGFPETG